MSETPFGISGAAAIVTGAARGIGRATALLLARCGASVIAVDRELEDLTATASEAADQSLVLTPVCCDVADEASLASVVTRCIGEFGRLDVVVNNAAIRMYGDVTETTVESWNEIFAVNLRSAAVLSKYAVPPMASGSGGAIVNVSSVHAVAGRPGMVQYDTMKAGMLALTRSLACDHAADGIRVNAVLPGVTLTDFHRRRAAAVGRVIDESEAHVPFDGGPGLLRRRASVDEIAYPIAFLASPLASYITGASLLVDGGVSAFVPSS